MSASTGWEAQASGKKDMKFGGITAASRTGYFTDRYYTGYYTDKPYTGKIRHMNVYRSGQTRLHGRIDSALTTREEQY